MSGSSLINPTSRSRISSLDFLLIVSPSIRGTSSPSSPLSSSSSFISPQMFETYLPLVFPSLKPILPLIVWGNPNCELCICWGSSSWVSSLFGTILHLLIPRPFLLILPIPLLISLHGRFFSPLPILNLLCWSRFRWIKRFSKSSCRLIHLGTCPNWWTTTGISISGLTVLIGVQRLIRICPRGQP